MQSIIDGVGMTSTMCSGPLDKAMTRTVKPAVVNQEPATPIPLSPYNHQGGTLNATAPDCRYTQSPKPVPHTEEDVTKTCPMEETAPSASLTSELAIISHLSLPAMPKRPPIHYPRDGTFPMNFDQSCLSFACCSPAVEVTTGHDDCEPLLYLTIVPEQESLRGNTDSEMAF